jgi:hypothetical protein
MPNLSDVTPATRIFALHIGESGDGKTSAMLSYPKPMYIFDIDGRIKGGLGHPAIKSMPKEELAQIDFDSYPMTKTGLEKMDKKLDEFISQGWKCKYKTIGIDTITSFDKMVMAYADAMIPKPAKNFGLYNTEGMDHYNVEKKALDALCTEQLKSLHEKINVVIGAHWTTRYESAGPGLPATIPAGKQIALRDKLAPTVPVWFDEVFFFRRFVDRVPVEVNGNKRMEDQLVYEVTFRNELARTTFTELPDKKIWTGKNFYNILMESLTEETRERIKA